MLRVTLTIGAETYNRDVVDTNSTLGDFCFLLQCSSYIGEFVTKRIIFKFGFFNHINVWLKIALLRWTHWKKELKRFAWTRNKFYLPCISSMPHHHFKPLWSLNLMDISSAHARSFLFTAYFFAITIYGIWYNGLRSINEDWKQQQQQQQQQQQKPEHLW